MRNILLFLACVLSTLQGMQAATFSEGFEDVSIVDANGTPTTSWGNGLSNGWKIVGGYIMPTDGSADYGLWSKAHTGSKSMEASYGSSNAAFVVIPDKLAGEFKFWARKTSTSSSTKGTLNICEVEKTDGGYTKKTTIQTFSLTTTWTEYTVDLGTEGRLVAINMIRAAVDDITFNTAEAATTPVMKVLRDGQTVKSGDTYDFGLADKETSVEYTVSNIGVGTLAATATATEGFAVSPATIAVDGGEETALTVSLLAGQVGKHDGSVTLSGEGLDDFIVNVKGIVRDPNKIYLDFSTDPTGWSMPVTESSSYYGTDGQFKRSEEGYLVASGSEESVLLSPALEVSEGETLYLRYTNTSSYSWYTPTLSLFWSADGNEWSQTGDNFAADATAEEWKAADIEGVPTNAKFIKIVGKNIAIDDIYGFSLPNTAVMTADATDYDFGFVTADTTVVFKMRNEGKKTLTGITVTSGDKHFSAAAPSELEPGASGDVTVTMTATDKGAHSATVTLKADEQDDITFGVSSYVYDKDAVWVSFENGEMPEGWTNEGWDMEDGRAYAGYAYGSKKEITSPQLTANEGEELVFQAKLAASYGSLNLLYSVDGGETWTSEDYTEQLNQSAFTLVRTDKIPAGNVMLKFEGSYVYIDNINGFQPDQNAPKMVVSYDGTAIAGEATADFGTVKAATQRTYTVANSGTGTLEVEITSSDETQFTVSDTTLVIAKDEEKTFGLTVVLDENFGKKAADIIIHPKNEGLGDVVLHATAVTKDSTIWEENFENSEIPSNWTNVDNGWWVVNRNGGMMAGVKEDGEQVLVTPRLKANKDEQLQFTANLPYDDVVLKIEYSNDEQSTWNEFMTYSTAAEYDTLMFTAPEDGYYYLRFTSNYAYLDDFYGFRYAPKEHDAAIAEFNVPTSVDQYIESRFTVDVTEIAGKEEELTATIYVDGEAQPAVTATVAPNGTQAISFAYTEKEAKERIEAYVEVVYAGGTLTSETKTISVNKALVLDEYSTLGTVASRTYPAAVLRYTAEKGWNTFCFPFAIDNATLATLFGEDAKAYTFEGANTNGEMRFNIATEFTGGYPYIVYMETPGESRDILLYDVTVPYQGERARSDSYEGITFQGTYAPMAAEDMSGLYVISPENSRIMEADTTTSLKAMRAYFLTEEGVSKDLVINFEDKGIVDRIDAATLALPSDGNTYDLSGRRMNDGQLKAGIYIRNGKKFIVK